MNRSEPHVSVQRLDVVLDYEAATAGLPVVEESMYPTSRGSFSASCTTAVTGKVAIGDKSDKRGSLRPIMKRILWVARPSGIPAASTGAGRPR